ncbi:DUF2442 domain-containing protein [Billgrantia desiderata]
MAGAALIAWIQGIHWPDIDEDLSTEGLLQDVRAPRVATPPPCA